MFQTYFRRFLTLTVSCFHVIRLLQRRQSWKRISLVFYLLLGMGLRPKVTFHPLLRYHCCSQTFPDLMTHSNLMLAQWQRAVCFILSPLSYPFHLHLKFMRTQWPQECGSVSITSNHECKYNCISQVGASIKMTDKHFSLNLLCNETCIDSGSILILVKDVLLFKKCTCCRKMFMLITSFHKMY